MPKYRAADLPKLLSVPLETLARETFTRARGGAASDEAVKERVRVALHEAAHLVASAYCRGYVTRVEIFGPGTARRTGVSGRVLSLEVLPDEEAFCSFVGYAWEELNGDPSLGAADRIDGERYASEAEVPPQGLLDEARQFVRDPDGGDELIRLAAAGVLAILPKSRVLQGRPLRELMEWFVPIDDSARPRASVYTREREDLKNGLGIHSDT